MMTQTPRATTPVPEIPDMPTYDARDLITEGTQARLVLDGTTYYLRITRAGKLILTK
ncbi:MAG: hemin uptake protein HemP [Pseudomonadota bacterium]